MIAGCRGFARALAALAFAGSAVGAAAPPPPTCVQIPRFSTFGVAVCQYWGRVLVVGRRFAPSRVVVAVLDPAKAGPPDEAEWLAPEPVAPRMLCDDPDNPFLLDTAIYRLSEDLIRRPTGASLPPHATRPIAATAYGDMVALAWMPGEAGSRGANLRVFENGKLVFEGPTGEPVYRILPAPERSLLYLAGRIHLLALNYHTGEIRELGEGPMSGRAGRCGNLLVLRAGSARQNDLMTISAPSGQIQYLSAGGYQLSYAACADQRVIYATGTKSWVNPFTEGVHVTDVRLFRYDPSPGRLERAGVSSLKSRIGAGLFALDGSLAYELRSSTQRHASLVNRLVCTEPADELKSLFAPPADH